MGMSVAQFSGMQRQQRWALVAGLASIAAVQLTEYVMTTGWRVATLKDPPDDPNYEDAPWKLVLLWTAGVGALAGVSEIVARRGAEMAWKRVTGRKPPRPRRRPRAKSRRQALIG
jgi:hypothetical protein